MSNHTIKDIKLHLSKFTIHTDDILNFVKQAPKNQSLRRIKIHKAYTLHPVKLSDLCHLLSTFKGLCSLTLKELHFQQEDLEYSFIKMLLCTDLISLSISTCKIY
jgi:hypothetical protein